MIMGIHVKEGNMNGFQKFSVIAGLLLSGILSACNAVSSTPLSESTEPPSSPPTSSPVPTITITPAPTIAPTEVPLFVRPESVDDSIFKYTEEQLDAIHSGKYQEGEEVLVGWLDFWRNSQVETGEPLNLEVMPLKYIYLFNIDNPENTQNVIVALESSDYPNTVILPPIDFEKSDGLSVYFKESLPYEESGHEVPSHLMPTFLTIDANEESVSTGKMQERFLNTTLTNKGGELVRIDAEGKVIAKIGVKKKTKEARWVRAELCTDYSNPDNYTTVTIDEIRKGQILFDEEIHAKPFPLDTEFPARFELLVNQVSGSVRGYYANGEPTTKFYRNAFFYMLDEKQDGWILNAIISQQYLNKDGSWSFVKRTRSWNGENPEKWVEKLAPDMAMLPTFFLPAEALTQSGWEYYREINNDDTIFSLDGNLQKLYEEYTITGFIPDELTRYIISGRSYVKVR